MRHGIAGRKFSRTSSHRKAMFANLATSLLEHGQIKTTVAKAKDLRRVVEPIITKAKKGDLAARREVMKTIQNKAVVQKLFDEIAPAFATRPGGYTRVLKAGFRQGDAADMAIIELTEKPKAKAAAKPAKEAKADKKEAKAEKAPAKKSEAKAEDK
ncbi:MAG: 50S ribosomal protein L17 [Magnetococcales bacterium]|nr:50S ribosomal protein L17 [Magnetococcales bacterium]PPR17353.1 MAG: 50S ribosomal protein L17 [Pseudomonadota bacterium]|tara:strand:+ start:32 stop:499 length:468 start_codon:yes stop_codon:yes gene_type:complete